MAAVLYKVEQSWVGAVTYGLESSLMRHIHADLQLQPLAYFSQKYG
jgi:hypothetical protein